MLYLMFMNRHVLTLSRASMWFTCHTSLVMSNTYASLTYPIKQIQKRKKIYIDFRSHVLNKYGGLLTYGVFFQTSILSHNKNFTTV